MALASARASFVLGSKPVMARKQTAARRSNVRSTQVSAKYGDDGQYFDLSDLENTIGSWDMYGVDNAQRYNGLQSEFFERAASGISRREYLNALVALGGGAAILIWGAKGAKDAKLPITVGPQKPSEPGPRGRL